MMAYDDDVEFVSYCPACADPIDYCQGHGAIGDPIGHRILWAHDMGDHTNCHPAACEEAPSFMSTNFGDNVGV